MTANPPLVVATCALSARETRLVGMILARTGARRFRYRFAVADDAVCDIVLVDPLGKDSGALLARWRARHPRAIAVYLTDGAVRDGNGYRLSRRALWSHLASTLDEIVVAERGAGAARTGRTPPPPRASGPDAAPAPLRAFVLDESAAARGEVAAALRALGIETDGAASWNEASGKLGSGRYDLLVLDVVLPGIDGFEVCRRLRRKAATRRLPVVMLTQQSSTFERARGALAGCDAYLVKPIDLPAFRQVVGRIVDDLCGNDPARARRRGYTPADR